MLEFGHWKSIPADPLTRKSLRKLDLALLCLIQCIHVKPRLSDDQGYLPGELRLGLSSAAPGAAILSR